MLIRAFARAIALVTGMAVAMQALAGGDDYDAANDVKGAGPAYFGLVRDVRGSPGSNAVVMMSPKRCKPVPLKTNALGLYRGRINKDVPLGDVQISSEKSGYKQTKVYRRTPP